MDANEVTLAVGKEDEDWKVHDWPLEVKIDETFLGAPEIFLEMMERNKLM